MRTFICKHKKKSWECQILLFKNHGNHYEFMIQSDSKIMVIFGKTTQGYFACLPDFNAGCHLSTLNDVLWNTERLTPILGVVDGTAVASALLFLAKELHYPEF